MPQYRVKCRVSGECFVDIVADNISGAMEAAKASFDNPENVEALSAVEIAGQAAEPDVSDVPSKYEGILEGDEG